MAEKKNYESTVMRIAGNILGGYRGGSEQEEADLVAFAVALARSIVAEVKRTESVEGATAPSAWQHATGVDLLAHIQARHSLVNVDGEIQCNCGTIFRLPSPPSPFPQTEK